MSNLLKDIYSIQFYDKFTDVLSVVLTNFDKQEFENLIFDSSWDKRELKDRMRHTTNVLHKFMPDDFPRTIQYIHQIIDLIRESPFTKSNLEFLFFPDYIETYGINHFDNSVNSMELITQFISCEFAVRPFILKYGDEMLNIMQKWSLHESPHVRRLASEGSRPRLPWAIALPELKKNPTKILPILDNLKNDPSEYVRRSVANSLNDITKDNPEIVIQIANKWKGISKETDAIIKHGCRTLLKAANPEIMDFFGLNNNGDISVSDIEIISQNINVGEYLNFSFSILNKGLADKNVRIEYAVYYLRQNGSHSKKVFKISEKIIKSKESQVIQRKQSFKLITTRKFYAGTQKLSIIINGIESDIKLFELTV